MSYEFGNSEEVLFPFGGGLNGDDLNPLGDDEYADLFDDEPEEDEDVE